MVLADLDIVGQPAARYIITRREKIISVEPNSTSIDDEQLQFDQAIAFPGLINSHDHLDFNLFPPLRNKFYCNYAEWGADIQQKNHDCIQAVLKIPRQLRTEWGIYKNLLNGVTTVVNHGEQLEMERPLITLIQDPASLHSVQFEKFWKFKLNKPGRQKFPITIHLGEGTDPLAKKEIDEFIRWNFFKREVIAIHGVAMSPSQAKNFKALVWCPASNFFLLNSTARIDQLKTTTTILFGTDSTLTAGWNIWEHLRMARKLKMMSEDELFATTNSNPAKSWGLETGKIAANLAADIIVGKKRTGNPLDAFFHLDPSDILLVMQKGSIRLFDESLLPQLKDNFPLSNYSKVYVEKNCKYVQGNIPALMNEVLKVYPEAEFPVKA